MSRVIHRQDLVRGPTRARSGARRHKEVIGIICVQCQGQPQDVEDKTPVYDDKVLRGVERRLSDLGWSLLIASWNGQAGHWPGPIAAMPSKVDGILVTIGSLPPRVVAQIASQVPVGIIAGDPDQRNVDVVTADNRSGSAALVRHLVEVHGRRRIFHVDGPPTAPDAKERRLALNEVIQAHHGVELVGSHSGRFSSQSGEEAGEKLLVDRAALPDAIVCANDQMAIGVLQALARGGVAVPEDLSVTGFDDIFPGSLFEPSLTTVHQPMRLLGERACARLLDRIAQPDLPPQVELLPTELVLRKSCGCPPGTAARTLAPQPGTAGIAAGTVVEAPYGRGRRHARPTAQS
jgi:LacI family transcriptional regulator